MSSLYLHIPFRRTVMPYRDEYYEVHEGPYDSYMNVLCRELDIYAARYSDQEVLETIYIGGGCPSLLSSHQIRHLLRRIDDAFTVAEPAEVTLEGTPQDLNLKYLKELRAAGINRLSVAVESFFADDLEQLGCRHSPQQAKASIMRLASVDFANYNIDLRFGIPAQPLEYWQANLQKSIRYGTPHLSTYQASTDSNLESKRNENDDATTSPPDESTRQYQFALDFLREQEYRHYELSHFARSGFGSRHLKCYWSHSNYVGLGPSAHSFWWPSEGTAYRWNNIDNTARYCGLLEQGKLPLETKERLSGTMLTNEYIMLRLQTDRGLDLQQLRERYNVDLTARKAEELDRLEQEKWIRRDDEYIRLTDEGKFHHDAITTRLLINDDL